MLNAGIDAGSRAIKIVLIDSSSNEMVASKIADQGVKQTELVAQLFDQLLCDAQVNRKEIGKTVATGYGRDSVAFADTTITEITCHARGVRHLHPDARNIVDIGGQDSKVLLLDPDGRVRDFAMNDRCAAGTGRFLEVVSERLDIPIDDLGRIAEEADAPSSISSMCVVFAETEIVGLLASGARPANIVAGIQNAISTRTASMAGRRMEGAVFFTGGVALIPGMDRALETAMRLPVTVASNPQLTGAIGAALLAE